MSTKRERKSKGDVAVKMKPVHILLIVIILVLIGLMAYGNLKTTGNVVQQDVFEGEITNMNLEPMTLSGEGVYDRSCNPVENGLTNCDAGIQTEKGLLNFNYKHDMNMQACLDKGDKLEVEILADGKAKVTRK